VGGSRRRWVAGSGRGGGLRVSGVQGSGFRVLGLPSPADLKRRKEVGEAGGPAVAVVWPAEFGP
jgi:hypothetical protein